MPTGPAASHHGHVRAPSSSQEPSLRTPPHGPNTIRFGQPGVGAAVNVSATERPFPAHHPRQTDAARSGTRRASDRRRSGAANPRLRVGLVMGAVVSVPPDPRLRSDSG